MPSPKSGTVSILKTPDLIHAMNPQSLHALIIDRHFGELTPEVTELLELHLAQNAEARTEAERVLESLNVTREAVLQYPELAQVPPVARVLTPPAKRFNATLWLARAAAVILFAGLTGGSGFLAGRSGSPSTPEVKTQVATATPVTPRKNSPWARYRMAFDPGGNGMQVVRVETSN